MALRALLAYDTFKILAQMLRYESSVARILLGNTYCHYLKRRTNPCAMSSPSQSLEATESTRNIANICVPSSIFEMAFSSYDSNEFEMTLHYANHCHKVNSFPTCMKLHELSAKKVTLLDEH